MNNLLKIGAGVVGFVGIIAGLSSLAFTSQEHAYTFNPTEDRPYQFLFFLAKKVFPYLKRNNQTATEGSTKKVDKDTLIEWLKEEFSQSGGDNSETWWNFKSICEQQKEEENIDYSVGEKNVHVAAARLCFVDQVPKGEDGKDKKGVYPKGWLDLWEKDTPGYEGFNATGTGVYYYNHQLLGFFEKKNPGSGEITQEIFEEWYSQQTKSITGQQSTIKNLLK